MRAKTGFTIENKSDRDLEMSIIYYPQDYFDIELPKAVRAGKKAECEIKLKKDYRSTEFNKSFTIELNDTNRSRFTVPVTRVIRQMGMKRPGE